MPTVTQKHENEVQAAFNRGRESANIDNLAANFEKHEKYDNIRFDQLKSGLKDNCDATNCVVEKIDSLILITKTRNEVAVEEIDNAAKIAENNLTTKKLYIALVGSLATVIAVIISIYEFIENIH
jgi:hypothetical protein